MDRPQDQTLAQIAEAKQELRETTSNRLQRTLTKLKFAKRPKKRTEAEKVFVRPDKLLPYYQSHVCLAGHNEEVTTICIDKDRMYSGSVDSKVVVWDKASLTKLAEMEGPEDTIHTIAVSPTYVFAGGEDKKLFVWLKNAKLPSQKLEGHKSSINSIVVDDNFCYTASFDRTIRVWDVKNFQCVQVLELHTGSVEALAVDKTHLYSASSDSTIAVWDKSNWKVVHHLKGHTDGVGAITVDNDRIYSGGYDEALKIWSKKDGSLIKTLLGHKGWIYNVVVQNDKIYSSSYDNTIRIWHVVTGQTIQVLDRYPNPSRIRCLAVDGKIIYAGLKDYTIQTWTTVPGISYVRTLDKHTASVKSVAVDESQFYTASVDKHIYRWNKTNAEFIGACDGHELAIKALLVYDDRLYSADEKEILVWNKRTGEQLIKIPVPVYLSIDDKNVKRAAASTQSFKDIHTESKKHFKLNCISVDEGRIYAGIERSINEREIEIAIVVWDKQSGDFRDFVIVESKSRSDVTLTSVLASQNRLFAAVGPEVYIYNKTSLSVVSKLKNESKEQDDGHSKATIHCMFIGKGLIYAGTYDGRLVLWDKNAKSGSEPKTIIEVNDEPIQSVFVDQARIYVGTNQGPIEIRDKKTGELIQTLGYKPKESSPHDKKPEKKEPVKEKDPREKEREAKEMEKNKEREKMGHASWVYSICVDEGKVYSGSFDKTVKIWDIECIDAPPFFLQCMAHRTMEDLSSEFMNEYDLHGRTPLMACARTGSVDNARTLVSYGCKKPLNYASPYGESAIFYALRQREWEFLTGWDEEVAKKQLKIDFEHDIASRRLLKNRATAGDIDFFENLLKTQVTLDSNLQREILDVAIKNNHKWFAQNWEEVNSTGALHSACFYGRPDIVDVLLERPDIQINNIPPVPAYYREKAITAIHICHMTAEHSELESVLLGDIFEKKYQESDKEKKLKMLAEQTDANEEEDPFLKTEEEEGLFWKQWTSEEVYDKFETQLLANRTKCFGQIMQIKELTKRPDWKLKTTEGNTSYQEALLLHNYAMEKMKIPKLEIKNREDIARRQKIFEDSSKVLDSYHEIEDIKNMRSNFAKKKFVTESIGYVAFLIILTAVGFMMSTNGQSSSYHMYNSVANTFLGDDFDGISDSDSFWGWFNGTFIENFYASENGEDAVVINFDHIIGAARMRQLKVRNDSCNVRPLYKDEISVCYAPMFNKDNEDTTDFGDGEWFQYKGANTEGSDPIWGIDNIWYPGGGFYVDLPNNNKTEALNMLETLVSQGWITEGTRKIFLSFTIYNANTAGSFVNVLLEFTFTAVGDASSKANIVPMNPNSYDRDITGAGVVKIIMQFIIIGYIGYAFLWTEISEMRESVHEAGLFKAHLRKYIQKKSGKGSGLKGSHVFQGLKNYWSEAWNYYEWGIIIIFVIIAVLEIVILARMGKLAWHAESSEYVHFEKVAILMDYQQDLIGFFVMLNWLRLLKYLRIPEFTGPTVQSIMDTLQASHVVIFEMVIIYIVLTFAIVFNIAFGTEYSNYSDYGQSFISIFQVIFGNWDYDSLVASNRVFGTILFFLLMLFLIFVLMNLLIGVLGAAYGDGQEVNVQKWNRFITRLMIETVEERKEEARQIKHEGKIGAWIRYFREKFDIRSKVEGLVDQAEAQAVPVKGVQQLGTIIYYNDDELDEMLTPEEEKKDPMAAIMNEKEKTPAQQLEEKIAAIESNHQRIVDQYKKDIQALNAKLDALTVALSKKINANK